MPEGLKPTPYNGVNAVLHDFREHIAALLGDNFGGMYLVGSLALGDFDPHRSDLDFIVVTESDISDDDFRRLQDIHARFDAGGSPWAGKIEAVYIPRNALRGDIPDARHYPQIEKGATLFQAPLEDGWVFQCHSLREHGVVIAGPDPRTLLDPIDRQAMRPAVAAIAGLWLEQAHHDPEWLDWVRQRDAQVFVVQTLCRMLYSLAKGSVAAKSAATRWGQATLGAPWSTLIESTLARQHEQGELLPGEVENTVAFIRYTVEQSR